MDEKLGLREIQETKSKSFVKTVDKSLSQRMLKKKSSLDKLFGGRVNKIVEKGQPENVKF